MKAIRGIIGIMVVLVLFFLVLNWVGDYRSASKKSAAPVKSTSASEATASTDAGAQDSGSQDAATEEQPATGTDAVKGVLVVEVDGLNFRKEPSGDSPAMRGLKKGERVDLLEDQGSWYKVRDKNGDVGYITSNSSYTRSVK